MSRLQKINERVLYCDRFTVYRAVSFLRENGVTAQQWQAVVGMKDLPCYLSFAARNALSNRGRMDSPDMLAGEANDVRILADLYCHPRYRLRAGDRIVVEKEGRIMTYWSGEPFVYPHHQHVLLLDNRKA